MERFTALIGFFGILLIAWALSADRRAIRWRTVGWGLALQIAIAVLVLKGTQIATLFESVALPIGRPVAALAFVVLTVLVSRIAQGISPGPARRAVQSGYAAASAYLFLAYNLLAFLFQAMKDIVNNLIGYTQEGTRFVFGNLGVSDSNVGLVLATQVLPTIIFIASIFAVLYYLGVMQLVVRFFARLMMRFMGASGAESTSVAASIFMGQTEAPLTIRPFLPEMTRSELMTIMTAGMAHVSGGIMAAYVLVAKVDVIHLLTAVIMTAPGAIMIAKMLVPETGKPTTGGDVEIVVPIQDVNIIDAAGRGAIEGLHLAANVAAMLIAFIALVALVNGAFGYVNGLLPWFPASLDIVLGWLFRPIAWAMGVSWEDSLVVGNLLGTRMVLNEFVAFAMLGQPEVQANLDPRSFVIATYALCGFANFASIAIQIGGIGSLAPSRRADLAQLGLLAMIAGTLANFMTATIAGMLL